MKTVAVMGASHDPSRFGNKAVRAFQKAGYKVYPINPTHPEVEGLACFQTIMDLPQRPDVVSVYMGPARLLPVLPEIASLGCSELWLNPGTDSPEVIAEARRLGLKPVQTCSILALGYSPADF